MTKPRPLQSNSCKSGRLEQNISYNHHSWTWPFSINLYLSANHWSPTKTGPEKKIRSLGGGNSNIFGIFIPKLGEDEPILTVRIFFKWVESKPPARSWILSPVPHASCWPVHLCRQTWKKCGEFVGWGVWFNEVNKVAVRIGGLFISFA